MGESSYTPRSLCKTQRHTGGLDSTCAIKPNGESHTVLGALTLLRLVSLLNRQREGDWWRAGDRGERERERERERESGRERGERERERVAERGRERERERERDRQTDRQTDRDRDRDREIERQRQTDRD